MLFPTVILSVFQNVISDCVVDPSINKLSQDDPKLIKFIQEKLLGLLFFT